MLCGRRCETDKTVRDFGRESEWRERGEKKEDVDFTFYAF